MGEAFTVYFACGNIYVDIVDIFRNEDTKTTTERGAYPAANSVEYTQTGAPLCGRYGDDGR